MKISFCSAASHDGPYLREHRFSFRDEVDSFSGLRTFSFGLRIYFEHPTFPLCQTFLTKVERVFPSCLIEEGLVSISPPVFLLQ